MVGAEQLRQVSPWIEQTTLAEQLFAALIAVFCVVLAVVCMMFISYIVLGRPRL